MKTTKLCLGATHLVLGIGGCKVSPTAPNPDAINTYSLFSDLVDVGGAPTILEAQLLLDGSVVLDQSYGTAQSDVSLAVGADTAIYPGNHTLTIRLVSQTTTTPTTYSVPKFDIAVWACSSGSLSDGGGNAETTHEHTQSGALTAGQGFTYSFYSPDCTPEPTEALKRSRKK
jgi:hypothetical protein